MLGLAPGQSMATAIAGRWHESESSALQLFWYVLVLVLCFSLPFSGVEWDRNVLRRSGDEGCGPQVCESKRIWLVNIFPVDYSAVWFYIGGFYTFLYNRTQRLLFQSHVMRQHRVMSNVQFQCMKTRLSTVHIVTITCIKLHTWTLFCSVRGT